MRAVRALKRPGTEVIRNKTAGQHVQIHVDGTRVADRGSESPSASYVGVHIKHADRAITCDKLEKEKAWLSTSAKVPTRLAGGCPAKSRSRPLHNVHPCRSAEL